MIQPLGVPSYSSSESDHLECILITGMETVLDYLMRNAMNPKAENEKIIAISHGPPQPEEEQGDVKSPGETITDVVWGQVPEDDKPSMSVVEPDVLEGQRRLLEGWNQYDATGQAIAKAALESDPK